MAISEGRLGKIAVSTDGITYNDLGGVTDISYSLSHDTVDGTTFDDVGYKVSQYGESQATFSVTFLRDESDTAQTDVRTQDAAKANLYVKFYPLVTTGLELYSMQTKINSLSISNARGAKVESVLELESTGAITISAQP